MRNKSTNFLENPMPAGVGINDNNIEFVGVKDTKTVVWLQNGQSHTFKSLPKTVYNKLYELFITDIPAIDVLSRNYPKHNANENRMVELYTYYMYGQLDSTADYIDGQLQPSENYRDQLDCLSLGFSNKTIDIDGAPLSSRFIKILDQMANGTPDKAIASALGICQSTFDFHKRNLFILINANSKPHAVAKAFQYHVLCAQ